MRRRSQQGLSLVEMMVGLAVGMLMVTGLGLMFANASRSSSELDRSARHLENGRFAIDLLSEDLAMAGFYGTAPVRSLADTVSPCAESAVLAADLNTVHAAASPPTLPFGLRGYTPAEAAALDCLPHHRAGTPAFALRRLEGATVPVGSLTPGLLYLQTSHHPADPGIAFVASTDGSGLSLRDLRGQPNPVRRFVVRVYYLARCSECLGQGDGIPTLKRVELRGAGVAGPSALAEGIEQLGLDYGFDTNGDGGADRWWGLNGSAAGAQAAGLDWGNVVAVRLSVVSRSGEPTPGHADSRVFSVGLQGETPVTVGPMGDAYKRRAYTTTVRLHSVAGAREQP